MKRYEREFCDGIFVIQISLGKVAEVVGGQLVGGSAAATLEVHGAEFDSRRVVAGQLFFALAGASTHGQSFVSAVKKQGAVAALVEDATFLTSADIPGIVVKDSVSAMQQLAAWWRKEVGLPVLAITGSVGKTTTKEIAAAILGTLGPGTFSTASFNNHVGVPYTLLQISKGDKWAVVEIGMNHRGEVAPLSRIAAPNVALVTYIAPAHIGNLGSLRAITQEKLDIAAGLATDGTLVLNSDCELLLDSDLLAAVQPQPSKTVYFGSQATCTTGNQILTLDAAVATADGIDLKFHYDAKAFVCSAPLFGLHHANNVAAALCGALALCPAINLAQAAKCIAEFQVPEKRFVRLKAKNGGGEIFDDSYNANPASMRAFFEATKPFYSQAKTWGVVLGEMRELGGFEAQYHQEIAEFVAELKPAFVVAVGEAGALDYERVLGSVSGIDFVRVANSIDAINALKTRPFEVLLVKGARGVKLEKLVEAIASKPG